MDMKEIYIRNVIKSNMKMQKTYNKTKRNGIFGHLHQGIKRKLKLKYEGRNKEYPKKLK